jgi:hypothetical protein
VLNKKIIQKVSSVKHNFVLPLLIFNPSNKFRLKVQHYRINADAFSKKVFDDFHVAYVQIPFFGYLLFSR